MLNLQLVNELRIDISKCYSELDNKVNGYLLQLNNGEIDDNSYTLLTNPLYDEMKKLKEFASLLKEFRMSYSKKNLKKLSK
jgi:hypothetical protein